MMEGLDESRCVSGCTRRELCSPYMHQPWAHDRRCPLSFGLGPAMPDHRLWATVQTSQCCERCGEREEIACYGHGRRESNLWRDGLCVDGQACDRRVAEERPAAGSFGEMVKRRPVVPSRRERERGSGAMSEQWAGDGTLSEERLREFRERLNRKVGEIRARYPHSCPKCGAAAYVGLDAVDCYAECDQPPPMVSCD